MKTLCLGLMLAVLTVGCGVEMLATTAVQGKLQAENAQNLVNQKKAIGGQLDKVNINSAIQTYFTEKAVYPATLQDLVPTYLAVLPTKSDGSAYSYDSSTGKILN